MKWTIFFFALLGLTACKNQTVNKRNVSADKDSTNSIPTVQYSEKELITLLDSIGNLNSNGWTEKLTFQVDSTLNNQIKLNNKLSRTDFKVLKTATKSGEIDLDVARRIFPQLEIGSNLASNSENKKLTIGFYSFDNNKKDFNEFAISIGYDGGLAWNNDVYFLKSDKVIAKHKIFHRYGLELKHFKNEINETVLYYKVNYESGTGIWWNQFNFYRYDKEELLPTLTEIENINLQNSWSIRTYWIESTILDTKPLKLKFVFRNQFTDTLGNQIEFINDSTEIKYKFDTNKKIYEPEFSDVKLNRLKLLTYFHAENELLFVNINYDLFKRELNSNDQVKRQAILNYLKELKNGLNRQ
ncbi:hypothetical protein CLU83_1915 [Flavobacterium sp. 1]|uniref:hypothetical protein n=1 Tax=Flavobacterium sp. 1 TaxID=2035200 RepID=UPI000C230A1C|nr:hypothetical protein [Flavobacterium sp. 1]PJJ08629.1 hypothetical protein CLU83_1915 [Flavobacterium sp. 1]